MLYSQMEKNEMTTENPHLTKKCIPMDTKIDQSYNKTSYDYNVNN